jgi:hypothetical protein
MIMSSIARTPAANFLRKTATDVQVAQCSALEFDSSHVQGLASKATST